MGRKATGIAVTDTAAIKDHVNVIRGRARTWTFGVADIQRIAEEAESRLATMCIVAKRRPGARVIAVSAGPTARAYQNRVNGAEIVLLRAHDGWRLVSYERRDVFPCNRERIDLQISRDQHERSVQTMLRETRATVIEKEAA